MLIEAFKRLSSSSRQPLELVIAGTDSPNTPGYLDAVRTRYAAVPNIRFTGYVAESAVPQLFGDAAVVVFPYTSTTGSSGVLHQAGSFGKAVVLPQLGDLAELVTEEGYAGEFFEPTSPASLATAIERIVTDPARRQALEMQNYTAAHGLAMADVVDWYILHTYALQKARRASLPGGAPRLQRTDGAALSPQHKESQL
jgi:glycosyltransferase involved in cell wall biosynthesis